MGVVMNKNKQSVRILSDFLHKGFHLGVDVGVQTHHVLVSFLVCGDAFFNPQVYEHSCAQFVKIITQSQPRNMCKVGNTKMGKTVSDANLIVGCAVLFGEPECGTVGPK